MANRKISGLTARSTPALTDVLPTQIADGSTEAGKTTIAELKTAFADVVTIPVILDGGGSALTTGLKVAFPIFYSCTIVAWEITSINNVTGSIVVDVWKETYANLPATVADTITGAEKPTITTAIKGQDTSVSWAVSAGDWLYFNIDSVTSLTLVGLGFKAIKT